MIIEMIRTCKINFLFFIIYWLYIEIWLYIVMYKENILLPQSGVVIPTIARNFSYFQETIESVLWQTHIPEKISLVFDVKGIEGRNNNKQALKFQDRIWWLQDQQLFEILENINKKWSWATRNLWIQSLANKNIPLIFFLDDDDIRDADKCRQQLLAVLWVWLEKFWAIGCNIRMIDENRNIFARKKYLSNKIDLIQTLWPLFNTSSTLVSTEALLDIGWFNENLETAQDSDLFYRLIKEKSELFFSNLPEELTSYRYYSGNMSHEKWFQQRLNGFYVFLKRFYLSDKKLHPSSLFFLFKRFLSLWTSPMIQKKYNEYQSKQ